MVDLIDEQTKSMPEQISGKQSHFVLELNLRVMQLMDRFYIEDQQCVVWKCIWDKVCIPLTWHQLIVTLISYWKEYLSQASFVDNRENSVRGR